MFNNICTEWRVIFSSIGSVLPGSHKWSCPLNTCFCLSYPVYMTAQELHSVVHGMFSSEALWWAPRWVHRELQEQKALSVSMSHCPLCLSLQSQSASPKQRKQSVFTPPALKGTASSCPALPCLGGSSGGGQRDQSSATGSCPAITALTLCSHCLALPTCLRLTIPPSLALNLAAAANLFVGEKKSFYGLISLL